jgi:peptide/nickel transport system substrate-binding protein
MFGKLKFRIALTIGSILALAVLAACGGGAATEAPAVATQAPAAATPAPQATQAPAATPVPAAPATVAATAAVPQATSAAAAGDDSHYSEATKILMSGGPKALAEANGETPRHGGTFLANDWEPIPFFDMHQTSFGGVYVITAPAYNGLLGTSPYDELNLEIIPDLAQSWELEDGGKRVVFHLPDVDVKWHDGAPFSSDDVKWTVDRIMNPPEGMVSPRRGVFASIVESTEAPDPDTFVVNLLAPSTLLVPLVANGWQGIIPKHISETDPVNAMMTQVVGTGAFRLIEEPSSTLWRYERNPDYWEEGLPYLDAIDYHIIQDPQTIMAAVLAERIYWTDSINGLPFDIELAKTMIQQNDSLVYKPLPSLTVAHFVMNTTKPPTDDLRVRQALSEAIRRESIAELGPQTGAVGTGNFPLGVWVMPPEMQEQLIGYGQDMDARIAHANELLADYEAEKGEIDWSQISIQCSSNISWSCPNGQVIQQLLKEIDVDVDIEPLDVTANRGNEVSGDYILSTLAAGLDFDDPNDTFGQWYVTNGGRWYQKHSIAELDALYEQQKAIGDYEERREVVWEMDKIAMNDAAYLILHWFEGHPVYWPYVKGYTATTGARATGARMKYVWLSCDAPTAGC